MASGEQSVTRTGTTMTHALSAASSASWTGWPSPVGSLALERVPLGCIMWGVTVTRNQSGSAATAAGTWRILPVEHTNMTQVSTAPDKVLLFHDYHSEHSFFTVPKTLKNTRKFPISVRLEPNITFGAVELWQESQYALVCADGFDDTDAKVVCHSLGYRNGISICCSVFGNMPDYKISINNVQCTGQESSILQCSYSNNADGCRSNRYASVACSNAASSGGNGTNMYYASWKIEYT